MDLGMSIKVLVMWVSTPHCHAVIEPNHNKVYSKGINDAGLLGSTLTNHMSVAGPMSYNSFKVAMQQLGCNHAPTRHGKVIKLPLPNLSKF